MAEAVKENVYPVETFNFEFEALRSLINAALSLSVASFDVPSTSILSSAIHVANRVMESFNRRK